MQHILHYSRCSPSAWIDCLNFQNRLRLIHCSYFYLSLFFLVLYVRTCIHTIINEYPCWIFTLDFFIHMWIFFDPVSVILCTLGPTQNPAWRNVSMGSNISYRTDIRQSTKSVEVWFCAAMIPIIVFPFHTPGSWAVLKRFARWMFKHSSDSIQLHSVNTQHWYLVSMSIST
jgi:hypothetical protein